MDLTGNNLHSTTQTKNQRALRAISGSYALSETRLTDDKIRW